MTYSFRAAHCALALIVLTLGAIYARPAAAQDFSDKPIRIIVGLAPGGATDVTARLIAQRLTQNLNTNVYVENKPGGAFEPAYHELTSAAPDGHTLFMISAAVTVTQPAQKDYPYDIRKMTPVTEVSEGPFILVGRKALNFRNVTDLVNYGKMNPGGSSLSAPAAAPVRRCRSRPSSCVSPPASALSTCPIRAQPRRSTIFSAGGSMPCSTPCRCRSVR